MDYGYCCRRICSIRSAKIFDDSLPLNFLGLSPELCAYENSKVVVLPVPYDGTTSYRGGTREGPMAIIHASRYLEYYIPQLKKDFSNLGIATLSPLTPAMGGPRYMIDKLYHAASHLLKHNKFVVMLGGEHTLTIGMVKALDNYFPNLGILQIDAHLDLRDTYEGTMFNHACAMRRLVDNHPLVQVAIRSVAEEEHDFVMKRGLHPYYIWKMRKDPMWQEKVLSQLPENVYITIDLDGLDPSIMPAVGTPEPDGLLWHEVIELIDRISAARRIVAFDIVELCPIPGQIAADYLTGKLAYFIIAMAHRST